MNGLLHRSRSHGSWQFNYAAVFPTFFTGPYREASRADHEKGRSYGGVETLLTGGPDAQPRRCIFEVGGPTLLKSARSHHNIKAAPHGASLSTLGRLFVCLERVIRIRYKWLLFIGARGPGVGEERTQK